MTRRDFLADSTAAGFMIANASSLFGADAPSNRVRLAIMGCHAKGRGFSLMQTAAKIPGTEIATVCDVDSRARADAARKIEELSGRAPKQELDIRKVLEDKDIDGVICAAPDHWHATAAVMTMKAGKAIYVEKPCCHNPREGEILVEVAKRTGVVFQMGVQRRSSATTQQAIADVHQGILGEPHYARAWYLARRDPIGKGRKVPVPAWLDWNLWQGPAPRTDYQDNVVHYNWHWFKRWGTGESGNNATHFVDIGRWALGAGFPSRVTCAGGRLFYEGDDWEWYDTQTVAFEFPGKKLMTWEGLSSVNACPPVPGVWGGCMVYGLKGAMLFASNDTCTLYDKDGKELKKYQPERLADSKINHTSPSVFIDPHHFAKWIGCIRAKDTATYSPAPEAYRSTILTNLANIALQTGESIHLDSETGHLLGPSAAQPLWSREYEPGWELKA